MGAVSGGSVGVASTPAGALNLFGTAAGGGATTDVVVKVIATCVNGATAGAATLVWAQNTQEATDTKVMNNSTLVARRIA